MKSTYSLLCIYLDGKKLPTKKPEIINLSKTTDYLDIDNDYSLFDYPICKRKISGIRILSANSADEINTAIKNLVNCKKVVIELDYYSVSKVACTLFLKRILQFITLLSKDNANTIFTLSSDLVLWNRILDYLYL